MTTSTASTTPVETQTQLPAIDRAELRGVRTGRVFGFFIDYTAIALLCVPFGLLVGVLGIPTLGLAWGIYPILPALVALGYLALTMGGPKQATWGMRMMGIKIKRLDGQMVDPLLACLHGILFWVIHSFAVIIPLLITFFSSRKRLIHDILLGTYVARA